MHILNSMSRGRWGIGAVTLALLVSHGSPSLGARGDITLVGQIKPVGAISSARFGDSSATGAPMPSSAIGTAGR